MPRPSSVRQRTVKNTMDGWSKLCRAGGTVTECVCMPRGTSLRRRAAAGHGREGGGEEEGQP